MSRPKLPIEEKRRRNNARMKRWYRENTAKAKSTKLMRQYGITYEDFQSLKEGTNCFICFQECPSGRRLAIDHDHKNGIVRGLLCINCNKGIGNFKDNINLLKEAIRYLTDYQEALKEHGYAADQISL